MGRGGVRHQVKVLVAAAIATSLVMVALFWTLDLQNADPQAERTDSGVIAFVSPQTRGAVWGWAVADEPLSPTHEKTVTARLTVASTDPEGISVVLGGQLADDEVRCFADGGDVAYGLAWEDLDDEQQGAILTYLSTRPVSGVVGTHEAHRTAGNIESQAEAEAGEYIVITPGLFEKREIDVTLDDGVDPEEDRTYQTLVGATDCSFPADAFWEPSGAGSVLAIPDVIARAGTDGAEFAKETQLYVQRTFEVDVSQQELSYSSVEPAYDDADTARFVRWWRKWDLTEPTTVSLAQVTAVLNPPLAEMWRQLTFLGIGFCGAVLLTLIPIIGRTVTPRRSR